MQAEMPPPTITDNAVPASTDVASDRDSRVTRVGRKVKLPSYLNDYELDI